MSSTAPSRNPSMAPAGPPRASQSSMMTSQPTPTMLPNPNVKYSSAPRLRLRLVGGDAKLFFECGEELRGAERAGRSRRRGLLEVAARARRIVDRLVDGFDRHPGFAGDVGIGPQPQPVRAGEVVGLEEGVAQIDEPDRDRVGLQQFLRVASTG